MGLEGGVLAVSALSLRLPECQWQPVRMSWVVFVIPRLRPLPRKESIYKRSKHSDADCPADVLSTNPDGLGIAIGVILSLYLSIYSCRQEVGSRALVNKPYVPVISKGRD